PIGLVKDFPDKSCAWAEVERQHLHINQVDFRGCVTFADLAHHYAQHELVEPTESIHPKAHTTIRGYERVTTACRVRHWQSGQGATNVCRTCRHQRPTPAHSTVRSWFHQGV